jgi:hypothetical protein
MVTRFLSTAFSFEDDVIEEGLPEVNYDYFLNESQIGEKSGVMKDERHLADISTVGNY